VKIIPSSAYSGVLELGCRIDDKSAEGCSIGKYLHSCTLKIIDLTTFPTASLEENVKHGNEESIANVSPTELIGGFVELCWTNPVVRQGTIKVILTHQYMSFVAVLNIFIMLFVIRTLNDDSKSQETKRGEMVLYASMWFFPFIVSHYLSYRKNYWKVGGSLRKQLQVLLLKKFLNYTDASRGEVATEQLLMGMVRDVSDSVVHGYIDVVNLVFGTLLRIVYLIMAMVFIAFTSPTGIKIEPIIAILSIPAFILIFLKFRQKKMFTLRQDQFDVENAGVKHVISTVINYQVIADYDRRTYMVQKYEKLLNGVNKANNEYNANVTNSNHFAPWLTTTLVALYFIIGGDEVISGDTLLSTFLSTIALFRSIGGEFEKAYLLSLSITSSYASIASLTHFLNLPIDTADRLHANRARRKFGRELREKELKKIRSGNPTLSPGPNETVVDVLPIIVKDISFQYNRPLKNEYHLTVKFEKAVAAMKLAKSKAKQQEELMGISKTKDLEVGGGYIDAGRAVGAAVGVAANKIVPELDVEEQGAVKLQSLIRKSSVRAEHKRRVFMDRGGLDNVCMDIEQGHLVAILGDHAQGKGTLMRLLAGQVFPRLKNGSVLFVPPHLRIVQVNENPYILGGESVFGNVMYGIKIGPGADLARAKIRAKEILRRLDVSKPLQTEYFELQGHLGPSGTRITRVDRQIISLARAFVMNPEMLVIHKADALLDDDHAHRVSDMFKEYVEMRGVCMDPDEALFKRRKRTLVFTARKEEFTDIADIKFEARGGTVFRKQKKA